MAYNKEFYWSLDKDLVGYGDNFKKEVKEPQSTRDPTAAECEDEANMCFTWDMDLGEELYTLAIGRLQDLCRQLAGQYPGFQTIRGNKIF